MNFARKYGTAATLDGIPLVTTGSDDYQTNPTLAAGDVKISKDGGAFANLTDLPAVTPAGGRAVRVTLTATEMQAARIVVQFVDQTSPKEWADQFVIVETFGHASAQEALDRSVNQTGDAYAAVAALSIPTANQNADALLDRTDGVETGWTVRKVWRIVAAVLAGKASGGPGSTAFRDITDTKARVTVTADANGDRSAVTLDGT